MTVFKWVVVFLLLPLTTWAQNAVQQVGPATKYDPTAWIQDHQIESASKIFNDTHRGVNPVHTYDGGGKGSCWEDAPTTGPYHEICIGHDKNGNAVIWVEAHNGATPGTLEFVINGVLIPLPGSITGLPIVLNNAVLKATPTSSYSAVMRESFASPGDARPMLYYASGSACTLNGGAGDDGSQVQSADGKCWIGLPSGAGAWDIRDFGCPMDGTTSCDVILQRAVNAAAGSTLVISEGKLALTGAQQVNLQNVTIRCDGPMTNLDTQPPSAYGSQGAVFWIRGSTTPFTLGASVSIYSCGFYYPDQVSTTAPPTVFPPLFIENPTTKQANNIVMRDNSFINVYELFRQTANDSKVQQWSFDANDVYCVFKCFTFRNVPDILRFTNNRISLSVFQNIAHAGAHVMGSWTANNGEVITIAGTSDASTQVLGILWSDTNFVLAYQKFLHLTSGYLGLSFFQGGFDAVGQMMVLDNNSCAGTARFNFTSVGYFYRYPASPTFGTDADPVFQIGNPFTNCFMNLDIAGRVNHTQGTFLSATGGSTNISRIALKMDQVLYANLASGGPYYITDINAPSADIDIEGGSYSVRGGTGTNYRGFKIGPVTTARLNNVQINGAYFPIDATGQVPGAMLGTGMLTTNTTSPVAIAGLSQNNIKFLPQANYIDKLPGPTGLNCGTGASINGNDFDFWGFFGTTAGLKTCTWNTGGNYTVAPLVCIIATGNTGQTIATQAATSITATYPTDLGGQFFAGHCSRP